MAPDRSVARLLRIGIYTSVGLLGAGVVAMIASGVSPLAGGPGLDLAAVLRDALALRPDGLLWLGLVAVVLTPSARVVAALVGYLRSRDAAMVLVSILILSVIAASVALAVLVEP